MRLGDFLVKMGWSQDEKTSLRIVQSGLIRVNGERIGDPSHSLKVGDFVVCGRHSVFVE